MLIWKNKGILVPVYLFITFIVVSIVFDAFSEELNNSSEESIYFQIVVGFTFLISGLWTYTTAEEYIKKDGKKIKLDIKNQFFFVSMKKWGYLFIGIGTLLIISFLFVLIKHY